MESIHETTNTTSEQLQEHEDEPDSEFIISKNFKGIRKKSHNSNTKFESLHTQNHVPHVRNNDTLTRSSLDSFPSSAVTDFSRNSDLRFTSAGNFKNDVQVFMSFRQNIIVRLCSSRY